MLRNALLCVAATLAFITPASAEMDCWGPAWNTFYNAGMGLSADISTDYWIDYYFRDGFPSISVNERARPGDRIPGRCSDFSFAMTDFRPKQITDPSGMFDALVRETTSYGLKNFQLKRNQPATVQGLPARDVMYGFNIDVFGTPATHRIIYVARGSLLYTFDWSWSDDGPPPDDALRIIRSIKFSDVQPNANLTSLALLQETIQQYWLHDDPKETGHLSAELRQIADAKRSSESQMVRGYGFFDTPTYLKSENGWKVVRISHEHAIVDWYMKDDGRQITALTWKKIRDQ